MPSPVAVHEAAHAVADHDLLPEFATPSVTIVPTETTLGCCEGPTICDCIDSDVRLMRRLMRALTVAKLVGCIAESRVSGEEVADLFSGGGEDDYDSARMAAEQYGRYRFERGLVEARANAPSAPAAGGAAGGSPPCGAGR